MKIACIGNMNNNFFNLVRYLRDNQIDAELLLLNNDLDHFHPSADSYDTGYLLYTRQLSWGNKKSFFITNKKKIREDLCKYDFIIGCGLTPAFLTKVGRSLDIFVPYGSDIYESPFFNIKKIITSIFIAPFQRRGIRNSKYISFAPTNPSFEKKIESLKVKGKRIYSAVPMIYSSQYNTVDIQKNLIKSDFYEQFKKIRENNILVLFHHSRLVWKNIPDEWSYKGNEKIIKGFASFIKNNLDIEAAIILFEYGVDVEETKKLIKELDIEKFVHWFPKMNRKDIMIGMYYADICIGEVGVMSWLTYGIVYETLAMAKPFMGYREDSLYTTIYSELYPMINVSSQNQITDALTKYIQNPSHYKEIGLTGYHWLLKYAIDSPIKDYLDIINNTNKI